MTHWTARAYCADLPHWTDTTNPAGIRAQVAACTTHCPVMAACLAWAKNEPDLDGVAGGILWRNGKPLPPPKAPLYPDWTPQDARAAHNAYTAGSRTPWAVEGHRAYDRARIRARRKRAA